MNEVHERLLGYDVRCDGVRGSVSNIIQCIEKGGRGWLACLNPHSYAEARRRPAFSAALKRADWLIPDGAGILLASAILGGKIRERVTGSDIFFAVNAELQKRGGGTVFFLGSTEENLSRIRERFARDWPLVRVVGTYSPPFKNSFSEEDNQAMIAAVNEVRPDVLWVGMTAPKQEEWIDLILPRLNVHFSAAIGAVFDFYSGRIKRSHPVFQRLGLEWLPRLLQEPRRLWQRTFISAPIFLWQVLLCRIGISGSETRS